MAFIRTTSSHLYRLHLGAALVIVISSFSITASGHRAATNIDCKTASSKFDHIVCSDPTLVEADSKLNATLDQDLEKLSDEGRSKLIKQQAAWLSFVRNIFSEGLPPAPPTKLSIRVSILYKKRQEALEHAITVTKDGMVIRRDESFNVYLNSDPSRTPAKQDVAFPQIDRPSNLAQKVWNTTMQMQAPHSDFSDCEGAREGDLTADYSVLFTANDFISVSRSESRYCSGATHGYASVKIVNRFLSSKRELSSCDIFDHASKWEGALSNLASAELKEDDGCARTHCETDPERLKVSVTQPDHWSFNSQGLIIQFRPLDVGGYAQGTPRIVIPWDKVKAYLSYPSQEHPQATKELESR